MTNNQPAKASLLPTNLSPKGMGMGFAKTLDPSLDGKDYRTGLQKFFADRRAVEAFSKPVRPHPLSA